MHYAAMAVVLISVFNSITALWVETTTVRALISKTICSTSVLRRNQFVGN